MKPLPPVIANVDVGNSEISLTSRPIPVVINDIFAFPILTPTFWLLFLICNIAQPMVATSFLVLVGPDVIYMGADGLASYTGKVSPDDPTQICKIQQTGKYFFTAAGVSKDPLVNFDLFQAARKALSAKRGSLRTRAARFMEFATPALTKSVTHLKTEYPEDFRTLMQGKDLTVVFASWENGKPLVYKDGWKVAADGRLLRLGLKRAGGPDLGNFIMAASDHGARRYYETHPEIHNMHPLRLFPLLLNVEIELAKVDKTVLVGPPIAVISITRNGAIWSEQGSCPVITPY
jgi:hypothetical protein